MSSNPMPYSDWTLSIDQALFDALGFFSFYLSTIFL